jgi:hypothetical protein
MSKHLFPEEQRLTLELSTEWQREVHQIIQELEATFQLKGMERDHLDVVWRRLPFPDGMLAIIDQKRERIEPLLAYFSPYAHALSSDNTRWDKVVEEATDVGTYWIFFAAIARMLQRRQNEIRTGNASGDVPESGSWGVPPDSGPYFEEPSGG